MNEPRRSAKSLTQDQQDVIRNEGWDWASLTTWQLQVFISSKAWQVRSARTLGDDYCRQARMRFLLGSIKVGLQLKAIMCAEQGLDELQKRIRKMGKKAASKGRLNTFDEAFLQYLQAEEAALFAAGGHEIQPALENSETMA